MGCIDSKYCNNDLHNRTLEIAEKVSESAL